VSIWLQFGMPRKTRRDKLAVKLHKLKKQQTKNFPPQVTKTISQPAKVKTVMKAQTQIAEKKPASHLDPELEKTKLYFKRDFQKSLVIIAGILTLQAILYMLNAQGVLRAITF